MLKLISLCTCFYLFQFTSSSTLTAPPLSALVVAFEDVYDLSLLANTLSDQGIDSTLIVPAYAASDVYNNLIDVEVLQLNDDVDKNAPINTRAVGLCISLFKNKKILKRVQELQPTFIIFPALRHDGCLLPFAKYIESIPVIWIGNPDQELYAFKCTTIALPLHSGGFWSRFLSSITEKSMLSNTKHEYVIPTLRLAHQHLPGVNIDLDHLYSNVRLVLSGADTVLRSNYAALSDLLVEVGCHHCRGAHPLPDSLHKPLIEHRLGTIAILLDKNYEILVTELANKLPQGREGQAVVWKIDNKNIAASENLYIRGDVDRQDLIGYSRTRVVLSHCTDTEFLEAGFHGTPMICLPRDTHESRNTARAVELGFARSTGATSDYLALAEEIANIVQEIHETASYRESARKVSLAIRDRLNPASDRLVFWLGYIARTENIGEKFRKVNSQAMPLSEDIHSYMGFLVGATFGFIFTGSVMVALYINKIKKMEKTKDRYTR